MGSIGNQNPFAPYDNYRDCSQGGCSIYCPQFCYLIFPPPPPPSTDDSAPPFSPLIIAIIVVLACAFVLASYYTFATRHSRARNDHSTSVEGEENREELSPDQWGNAQSGLDETLIKKITVCKYQKGDGLIEGTDCAVCLCEFQENESLRLMPKCSHAFHLPCIDTWLKSQSNCPLCRANVVALTHPSPPPMTATSVLNMNPYESRRPDDLVLVVDDQERNCDEQTVVVSRNAEETAEIGEATAEQLRTPGDSLGTCPPHRQLLISDILKYEEIDECIKVESDHLWRGTGSSSGNRSRDGDLLRSPVATKKFIPGGRFLFGVQDKGNTSMLSN